jgi:hypothetical protein
MSCNQIIGWHKRHLLPTVTECNAIPDNKDEIPTPDIAMAHPHLRLIADQIPEPNVTPTSFCSLGEMYHHFTKFESLETEGETRHGHND